MCPRFSLYGVKRTILIVSSQRLMLELLEKTDHNLTRERAYKIVQEMAQKAWTQGDDFKALVLANREITSHLKPATIEACFDPQYFVRHTDEIFTQAGL